MQDRRTFHYRSKSRSSNGSLTITFEANKEVIEFVQNAVPGAIDKYVGTLDYATARFNTILLRLSEDPIMLDEFMPEARDCFEAIQTFYRNYTEIDHMAMAVQTCCESHATRHRHRRYQR